MKINLLYSLQVCKVIVTFFIRDGTRRVPTTIKIIGNPKIDTYGDRNFTHPSLPIQRINSQDMPGSPFQR